MHPVPLLPMYANFWNGAMFPGHDTGNPAGNYSGSDRYPSASAYGQPMLVDPNFRRASIGEFITADTHQPPPPPPPPPTRSPLLILPHPPSVYPSLNAQGESAAV
ncbi:hypothetical protein BJY52DRAFT_1197710 [Lactarius psammicola]|nr:hypothetical protein BJY52DRAFT_1197710 [Lactarius psammicola]